MIVKVDAAEVVRVCRVRIEEAYNNLSRVEEISAKNTENGQSEYTGKNRFVVPRKLLLRQEKNVIDSDKFVV